MPHRRTPPVRYRDAHGHERLHSRRQAIAIHGRLYCPHRHRIPDARLFLEEGVFRCPHKDAHGREDCGIILLAVAGFVGRDGTELVYAVEVTHEEVGRMRKMSIAEQLEYLEATWEAMPGQRAS